MKVCPICGKKYSDTTTLCSIDAAVLQNAEDPLVGQTLAGKYAIEKLIKSGGMGTVYRGRHVLMDKTVAIKVLRPSLAADDAVVARFSREAKAASRISHPHAVNVTDFGEAENGVVFLVMEYLDGRTLKEVIKSEGPMALDRVVEIVRQVAGALDAAHHQGVVHRDLKSDNIMLSRTDGGEWAKVLDFGIAKIQQPKGFRDTEITAANLVVGTPQYMSPEQCSQSGPIDARSDIYSLGIIVYEMLAGRVPFTGESPTGIMIRQVQEPPPSLLAVRSELPAEVGNVVARALAKQPAARFQTAGELAGALSHASLEAPEPAAASAPSLSAVVPATVPNTPVSRFDDELDEITVVRPRQDDRMRIEVPSTSVPAPAASFNPWRIMIPALVALVVVFGVVFLLTRGSGQTQSGQTQGQTGLSVDPNSQPVQPAGAPTGESERGIQAVSVPSPSATNADPNVNVNANQKIEVPAGGGAGNFGANSNANENSRGNKNANQPTSSPSPKLSPSVQTKEKSSQPGSTPSQKPSPRPAPTPPLL